MVEIWFPPCQQCDSIQTLGCWVTIWAGLGGTLLCGWLGLSAWGTQCTWGTDLATAFLSSVPRRPVWARKAWFASFFSFGPVILQPFQRAAFLKGSWSGISYLHPEAIRSAASCSQIYQFQLKQICSYFKQRTPEGNMFRPHFSIHSSRVLIRTDICREKKYLFDVPYATS